MSVNHLMRKRPVNVRLLFVMSAVLGLSGCTALPGQGPSTSDVVGSPQAAPSVDHPGYLVTDISPRVTDILKRKQSSSFQGRFGDYRPAPSPVIGVGDVLSVTIWEAGFGGLFSSPVVDRNSPGSHTAVIPDQVVSRDGLIAVPYAGSIQVVGATQRAVEAKIVKALANKAIEPQVLVTITRNLSNTVTVSGEVAGARVPLSPRGDRVLDVLASAGGVRSPVHESFVSLSRDGRTVTVPMQVLTTNPSENIFVRPGDTLTVVRAPQSFTAFGATGRNALVTFDAVGITLEEAVAKAGGLVDMQSDPSGVFMLRREPVAVVHELDPSFVIEPGQTTANVVYRIDLRNTNTFFQARSFQVQDKDIIYVANAPSSDLQKFLAMVQMASGPVYSAKYLAN